MNFDGSTFQELARELVAPMPEGTSPELASARLRSAMSRAYYATFWAARALLAAEGERFSQLDAHHQLIRVFEDSPSRARQTIGDHLRRLRYTRNEADYGAPSLTVATLQERAAKALRLADVVLASLARLTP